MKNKVLSKVHLLKNKSQSHFKFKTFAFTKNKVYMLTRDFFF